MFSCKILLICMIWTIASASSNNYYQQSSQQGGGGGGGDYGDGGSYGGGDMNYKFNYDVNDSPTYNFQSRQEEKTGNQVRGSYRVLQPDGKLRIVNYYDNGYGLQAEVTYQDGAAAPFNNAGYRAPSYGGGQGGGSYGSFGGFNSGSYGGSSSGSQNFGGGKGYNSNY